MYSKKVTTLPRAIQCTIDIVLELATYACIVQIWHMARSLIVNKRTPQTMESCSSYFIMGIKEPIKPMCHFSAFGQLVDVNYVISYFTSSSYDNSKSYGFGK